MKKVLIPLLITVSVGTILLAVYLANQSTAPSQSSAAITKTTTTCTYTYSEWSSCVNGSRSRSILTRLPAGCVGGDLIISESCNSNTNYCYSSLDCSVGEECDLSQCLSPCADNQDTVCTTVCAGMCVPIDSTLDTSTSEDNIDNLTNDILNELNDLPLYSCGLLDYNNDSKVDILDFANFVDNYGGDCEKSLDTRLDATCGYIDNNNDGKVDIVDFSNFVNNFGKNNCSI